MPSQFRQYGIKSPLTTNFINSELRYSYGAPDGRGKAELALLYKKLTFGNTSDVQDTSEDFYTYIQQQEWHENSPLRRYLTSTRREHVFAIALLLTSVITITTQKKTVMNTICFTA